MTEAPATEEPGTRRRAVAAVVVLAVFGAVVFVLSREASGTSAPAGGIPDVGALVRKLTEEQRPTSAGRVRARCEGAVAEPCGCVKAAIHEALDASLVEQAKDVLARGKGACAVPLAGQEAELSARESIAGADAKARAVLATSPTDPYAAYALAHVAWAGGDAAAAEKWTEAAVAAGRGAPAHLLVGLLTLSRGEVEAARGAFTRVLETEPADVAALYDIALCDHRLGRYRLAREGYLAVLRKNPHHLDARYNIALLTQGAGFQEEAAHHLAALRKAAPGDPRISSLEASLAAAAPSGSAPAARVPPVPSGANRPR